MFAACIDMGNKTLKVFTYPIWHKTPKPKYWTIISLETRERIGLEPLTDFLNYFGGWPMTMDSWNESHFDWKDATTETIKYYSSAYLINIYNDVDQMNANRSVIYVIIYYGIQGLVF